MIELEESKCWCIALVSALRSAGASSRSTTTRVSICARRVGGTFGTDSPQGATCDKCRSRGGLSTKIHLGVRGFGRPVRLSLPRVRRDAPQVGALIEGLPAGVNMADTAYDADHLRQSIAAEGTLAVIPNKPSRSLKHPLDKHLYAQRHLVKAASQSSSSSDVSQPASKKNGPKLPGRRRSRSHCPLDALVSTPPRGRGSSLTGAIGQAGFIS